MHLGDRCALKRIVFSWFKILSMTKSSFLNIDHGVLTHNVLVLRDGNAFSLSPSFSGILFNTKSPQMAPTNGTPCFSAVKSFCDSFRNLRNLRHHSRFTCKILLKNHNFLMDFLIEKGQFSIGNLILRSIFHQITSVRIRPVEKTFRR